MSNNKNAIIAFIGFSFLFITAAASIGQDKAKEEASPLPKDAVITTQAEKAQESEPVVKDKAQTPNAAAEKTTLIEKSVTAEKAAPPEKPEEKSAATGTEAEEAVAPAEEEQVTIEPGNVTVNFKDADIKTVLAYIAEVSGVDIVPAPDVKSIVDLKLTNKPWKVALDIIVRNYGFAYEREGDIIRVVTIDKLKQEELTTQAFNLNYGKSKDVVNGIKDIVSERGKVMYDERTNTVLVTDIPTNIYKISQIISRLDKRTDQVLIETRIIETTLNDDEKLGIDWNVKITASGAKRPTTFPFEAFKTPFNTKSGEMQAYFPQVQTDVGAVTGIANVGTAQSSTADFPGSASGIFSFPFAAKDQFQFGTLDFTEFKAVLEMIKSRANTDVVANPRVATLNNNEAIINVGETLNMPKYERNSTTGKMEITGYEAKDLGIILKVTPHVNDNGEIVIDLNPMISDLLRYDTLDRASGVVAPVFSTRFAKTQVLIRDGDTIFIGGLIRERNIDTRKKLPFLGDVFGDVPYFGLLFTKKDTIKEKTELIFFITVNLMATGKEIKNVPLASKAYVPLYTATQGEDLLAKKRLKKQF